MAVRVCTPYIYIYTSKYVPGHRSNIKYLRVRRGCVVLAALPSCRATKRQTQNRSERWSLFQPDGLAACQRPADSPRSRQAGWHKPTAGEAVECISSYLFFGRPTGGAGNGQRYPPLSAREGQARPGQAMPMHADRNSRARQRGTFVCVCSQRRRPARRFPRSQRLLARGVRFVAPSFP